MSSRVARRLVPVLALAVLACASPDPLREVELGGLETYWAIDRSVGDTHYIAPVVRFHLQGRGGSHRSVQATAVFRRQGETESWGSAWKQVTAAGRPLEIGRTVLVVLTSDARYYSSGPPEGMFDHKLFKDAWVEVFVRVGSSDWVKFATADVERRIGSRSVQDIAP